MSIHNDLTFFTNEPERNLYDRFNKILKIIKEYKFKPFDYKVFFWADYSELNKKDK